MKTATLTLLQLNSFLRDAKLLASQRPSRIAACIGNESCDLDSATCAIVRAFALSQQRAALVVPVMNCAGEDFALRTDILHHFRAVGVDTTHLLFEDGLALDDYAKRDALELFLVDHNRLAMKQAHWERFVVDVVDHHKDEQGCVNAKSKRIAFPMGSCSTLVAADILETMCLDVDAALARLLLGVILVDTGNLESSLGKTEPLDKAMSHSLGKMAGIDQASQTSLWEKINAAKFDVALLSTFDMLRKDYKEFAMGGFHVGISAVLDSLGNLDSRGDIVSSVDAWMAQRKLHILLVMTAFYDGQKQFCRQLMVCFRPEQQSIGAGLTQWLASQGSLQLAGLPSLQSTVQRSDMTFHLFSQANITASRKQVQPLTESFFASNKL